ncbi:uncharacterized protein LOC110189525 [Drosophila serrata]|uniref:uncharacterized protein LOC110189525 n=1 Tax=Drosophila serrata TaxID=7274 RepID=UPI000A1CF484|nr:uncharacterized protein LOC110189525 [Drosophila serrata]XP_020815312.1 uncharacterized protein LOC110189525 [Drosophila serrata]XP_020815314.1 uncharacterized protein LOC110189525 [Drosophila serrata]
MVGSKHISKLVAKERNNLLRRCALKRLNSMEIEDVDTEASPIKIEKEESLELFLGVGHEFVLEDPAEPEHALNPTHESQPKNEVFELTKRVHALEEKLEENTNILKANTKVLAESTLQVSKLTALLQVFLKGKSGGACEVSFPIANEEALAALEFKIGPTTKAVYIQEITHLLKYKTLPKSIKRVLAEEIICDFNIDGVSGKKSLRAFPEFFSVLIQSIGMLNVQQPPDKALSHALSCVKNNASKKKQKQK